MSVGASHFSWFLMTQLEELSPDDPRYPAWFFRTCVVKGLEDTPKEEFRDADMKFLAGRMKSRVRSSGYYFPCVTFFLYFEWNFRMIVVLSTVPGWGLGYLGLSLLKQRTGSTLIKSKPQAQVVKWLGVVGMTIQFRVFPFPFLFSLKPKREGKRSQRKFLCLFVC